MACLFRAEPQRLADGGGHDGGRIVHGHDGSDWAGARVVAHEGSRCSRVVEGQRQEMIRKRDGHGVGLLGRHHEIHVEAARGLDEILRAVGRRRDEQEQSRLGHGGRHGGPIGPRML
jgi:hypothetical protein